MENKKTIILMITISLLLVIIIAASYSFFASYNKDDLGNVVVNANVENNNSLFTSSGTQIEIDVPALMMQEVNVGSSISENGSFNVTYLAGTNNEISCSYDIYYKWVSGEYTIIDSNEKEFTYDLYMDSTLIKDETNFVQSDNLTPQLVVSGRTISNSSESTPTVQTYTITEKYYNINKDQSLNEGKAWKINFYVDNIVC